MRTTLVAFTLILLSSCGGLPTRSRRPIEDPYDDIEVAEPESHDAPHRPTFTSTEQPPHAEPSADEGARRPGASTGRPAGGAGFEFGWTVEQARQRCARGRRQWRRETIRPEDAPPDQGIYFSCSGPITELPLPVESVGLKFCGGQLCWVAVDFNVTDARENPFGEIRRFDEAITRNYPQLRKQTDAPAAIQEDTCLLDETSTLRCLRTGHLGLFTRVWRNAEDFQITLRLRAAYDHRNAFAGWQISVVYHSPDDVRRFRGLVDQWRQTERVRYENL